MKQVIIFLVMFGSLISVAKTQKSQEVKVLSDSSLIELYNYICSPPIIHEKEKTTLLFTSKLLLNELEKSCYDSSDIAIDLYGACLDVPQILDFFDKADFQNEIYNIRFYGKFPDYLKNKLIKSAFQAYASVNDSFKVLLGMAPPVGIIYISIFENRDSFNKIFQKFKEFSGFTIYGRFIFLPLEYRSDAEVEKIKFPAYDTFYSTLKHELAHVFLNNGIGYFFTHELDTWFQEAVAIRLGGEEKHRFPHYGESDLEKEYRNYEGVFRYLYRQIGRENFKKFLNESIETRDPDETLKKYTGYYYYDEYYADQRKAQLIHEASYFFVPLLSILFLIVIYVIVKKLKKKAEPEELDYL